MNRYLMPMLMGAALVFNAGCSHKDKSDADNAAAPDSTAATTDPSSAADAANPTAPATPDNAGMAEQNDQSFFEKAAEGGMAEVEAGKLAQSKGSSAGVKSFAAMMVKDHSKANEKLQKIATAAGVTLPAELNADHEATKAMLSGMSGKEFDKEYIKGQIKDHQATVELLQAEIDSGTNSEAKAFATEILPTVQSHLDKVKKLAASSGVDAG